MLRPVSELRHFTNRHAEQAAVNRLLDLPAGTPLPVVAFHGVGGAGKSWLLQKLKQELAQDRPYLPTAMLNLDADSGGPAYHTSKTRCLVYLRQEFERARNPVACPRFDLALAWLRFHEWRMTSEPVPQYAGPIGEIFSFIKDGMTSAVGQPGIGRVIDKIGDYLKGQFKGTNIERKLLSEDYRALQCSNPQQIYPQLVPRFAQDLNDNLESQVKHGSRLACRAVIFLDTFEALGQGLHSRSQQYERERWIRELHQDGKLPALIVVAGRDHVIWGEREPGFDPRYADVAMLEQHLVGGLSVLDSRQFLERHEIADLPLQDAILLVSEDTETQSEKGERGYHAYSLGLCADAVANERAAGRTVDPASFDMRPDQVAELTHRFLKTLSEAEKTWVIRLALTPRFDDASAFAAYEAVEGHVSRAAWKQLLGYSFVQSADKPGWRTLHTTMRDALATIGDVDGHAYWRDYWHGRSKSETDAAASLAWYHRWKLNRSEACDLWMDLARRLRSREARTVEHVAILDWWRPTGWLASNVESQEQASALYLLGLEYVEAAIGDQAELLRQAITCFELALKFFTREQFPEDYAYAKCYLGVAYLFFPKSMKESELDNSIALLRAVFAKDQSGMLSLYDSVPDGVEKDRVTYARTCFEEALEIFQENRSPDDWASVQRYLGIAHLKLAGNNESGRRKAIECYTAAARILTEERETEEWGKIQIDLGNVHALSSGKKDSEQLRIAIDYYRAALRAFSEGDHPEAWAIVQHNLGSAFKNLASYENLYQAIDCFRSALRVRTAERFPLGHAETQDELASALLHLGESLDDRSFLEQALIALGAAEVGFQSVGLGWKSQNAAHQVIYVRSRLAEME